MVAGASLTLYPSCRLSLLLACSLWGRSGPNMDDIGDLAVPTKGCLCFYGPQAEAELSISCGHHNVVIVVLPHLNDVLADAAGELILIGAVAFDNGVLQHGEGVIPKSSCCVKQGFWAARRCLRRRLRLCIIEHSRSVRRSQPHQSEFPEKEHDLQTSCGCGLSLKLLRLHENCL